MAGGTETCNTNRVTHPRPRMLTATTAAKELGISVDTVYRDLRKADEATIPRDTVQMQDHRGRMTPTRVVEINALTAYQGTKTTGRPRKA